MLVNWQRCTDKFNYGISAVWNTKPGTTPQNISRLLMGPEEVAKPSPCKLYNDDGDNELSL
jgi:hypothetical protein